MTLYVLVAFVAFLLGFLLASLLSASSRADRVERTSSGVVDPQPDSVDPGSESSDAVNKVSVG